MARTPLAIFSLLQEQPQLALPYALLSSRCFLSFCIRDLAVSALTRTCEIVDERKKTKLQTVIRTASSITPCCCGVELKHKQPCLLFFRTTARMRQAGEEAYRANVSTLIATYANG